MINLSHSSSLTKDKKGYAYVEMIKKILFHDMRIQGKDILVLGAGGFTLSAESTWGNQFYYVDIETTANIRAGFGTATGAGY